MSARYVDYAHCMHARVCYETPITPITLSLYSYDINACVRAIGGATKHAENAGRDIAAVGGDRARGARFCATLHA